MLIWDVIAFVMRTTLWIFYGFVVLAITVTFLFAGQRITKDYIRQLI